MRRIEGELVSFPFTGTYCVGIYRSEFLLYVSKGLAGFFIGLVICWYCNVGDMVLLVWVLDSLLMCEEYILWAAYLFTHYLFISSFFVFFFFLFSSWFS